MTTTTNNTVQLKKKSSSKTGAWLLLIGCLAVPLAVGFVSSWITMDQMEMFGAMNKPALAPPAWLFPIAWTILYVLMGIASFLILRSDSKYKVAAICFYISMLIMNFMWSPVFFNRQDYLASMVIIVTMGMTTIILAITSWFVDKRATYLLIPLILWTGFATYLNAGIAMLN